MLYINQIDIKEKRIFIRVDCNVPLDNKASRALASYSLKPNDFSTSTTSINSIFEGKI